MNCDEKIIDMNTLEHQVKVYFKNNKLLGVF